MLDAGAAEGRPWWGGRACWHSGHGKTVALALMYACVCVSGIESKFQVKSEERDIFKATEIISGVFKGVSPIHNIKILSFCVYDHKSP